PPFRRHHQDPLASVKREYGLVRGDVKRHPAADRLRLLAGALGAILRPSPTAGVKRRCVMRAAPVLYCVLLVATNAFAADPKARKKLDDAYIKFTPEEFVSRVASGDRKTVELFLQAGIAVDAPGARGRTALLEAAS